MYGGWNMNPMEKNLLHELISIRTELKRSLQEHSASPMVSQYKEEELQDINEAIEKIRTGHYGLCEMSGEILPYHILQMIPTIKSKKDLEEIQKYYCKSIF